MIILALKPWVSNGSSHLYSKATKTSAVRLLAHGFRTGGVRISEEEI